MQLDPVIRGFLESLAAQPGPKMWELAAPDARAVFAALMQLVGPQDVPIGKVFDMKAQGPRGDIPLRNYTPKGRDDALLPTLVFYHGGGFVIGDLETHDGLCRMFANQAGVRVIAVDYRLAPEHKFPAAVEDACAAIDWICANAPELGVDATRVAVGGDSAGGNLSAVVAQAAKTKGGPKLAFQMLLFPVTQIGSDTKSMRERGEGFFLEKAALDWWFGQYLDKGADRSDIRMSPLLARDLSGLPPAYLMLAGFDPLYDEGSAYAGKLRDASVAVTVADYPDLVHDFIYLQAVLPQAGEALRAASAALHGALFA
ncbi:MAG TPA: alpha/beta hydrolase [Rhizomicrobium sp.]